MEPGADHGFFVERTAMAGLGTDDQKSAPALAWRGYHNFDLLVIFCACSMQNVPGGSVMFQMDFRTK